MLTTQGKLSCPDKCCCYYEQWEDLWIIAGAERNRLVEFIEDDVGYGDGDDCLERE